MSSEISKGALSGAGPSDTEASEVDLPSEAEGEAEWTGLAAVARATVAIIGRPNVGKSTLFNRLVGRRQAIVHDLPGITRDRIFGDLELDDGSRVELIDTGGLVPGDDPLGLGEQVRMAIDESDLLLFVVDGKDGLVAADEKVWESIRPLGKATFLLVNKGDTRLAQDQFNDFYRLGIGTQMLVSAEHGTGIVALVEALEEHLPRHESEDRAAHSLPSLAIIGRPNVGKSSLVNRLLGEERVLVSPTAGTTRDPIDSILTWEERSYRLIDTAGIRRRSQVTGAAEGLAVMFARRQIERSDVALLVIDAAQGVTSGDMAIAGQAWEMGRPVAVLCNKWDLLDERKREKLEDSWPRLETLLASPPRVNVSAMSGRRLDRLLPAVDRLLVSTKTELPTSEVNRVFEQMIARHQAPQLHGKPWRMYYATQVGDSPPTFMLFANRTLERRDPYRRYLENRLRELYDFQGVPVRLVIRKR